jgi:hypothetical protein
MPVTRPDTESAPAFCLSLHIRHPSLDPKEISRELQLAAEDAFGAGEPRRRGGTGAGVHGESFWVARLDPVFWRRSGQLRSFDPRPAVEACVPAGQLPADRQARFESLIGRGRSQGYLTHAELEEHLPGEFGDGGARDDVVRTLAELGIPVHELTSPALAAIQGLRSFDVGPLRAHLDRHPALHLTDVLSLVCLRLARQHAAFLARIRRDGGSVRLLVTLSVTAVHGLTLPPELTARLAQLGVTLELALATIVPSRRPKARAS